MKNNYCVIMAGGIGSRFWPVSKTAHPKQFIDILGTGESLIQQTFNRVKQLCPVENIFVVTNAQYRRLTLEQLPELNPNHVIAEPSRRNTAPCIAYANFKIKKINPDANILVTPADHLILKNEMYVEIIKKALDYSANNDALVTIGIAPSRPDTGYGYIKYDATSKEAFTKVEQFTEKPDLEKANRFLASGNYSWNSGMFIWSLKSIMHSMQRHLPEVYNTFEKGEEFFNTDKEEAFIEKIYAGCPDISIDYGIMEKAKNAYVVSADLGWSDLGTWGSLYTHINLDKQQNAVVSGNTQLYNSSGNIIRMATDKLTVLQGIDNCILVETENELLICKKENEQEIKTIVNGIRERGDQQHL
jgi:mannose-1-phosphate guanylyltransferase